MHGANGESSFRNHAGDSGEPMDAEVLEGFEVGLRAGGDQDPLTAATTQPAAWSPPKRVPQPGEKGF